MKTLKYIIISLSLLATIGATKSCVDPFNVGDAFLEKAPGADVNIETVFSKAENARYFLWDAYRYLFYSCVYRTDMVNEGLTDTVHSILSWDDLARVYYPGSYNKAQESGWIQSRYGFLNRGVWEAVRACWIFIENVERVPDMDATEKARMAAEAKIIIASRYFDLLRHTGGLPIIDHAYGAAEEYNAPRATIEDTIDFVVGLLDEAAATPELPWSLSAAENSNWAGRLTKAAAMGVKCKVLLFAASPLFNSAQPYTDQQPQIAVEERQVWYGGFRQDLWERCLKACEEFFAENARNGNYYALVMPTGNTEADYMAAFRRGYWTRGNSEKIFEVHDRYNQAEGDQGPGPGNISHQGALAPTLEYMEMFPMADGTPFNGNAVYNTDNPGNVNIFEGRDPRLYESILVQKRGLNFQGRNVEIWEGGTHKMNPPWNNQAFLGLGMGPRKWILDYWDIANEPFQWPYLRMAEMHFIYAEALAETGDLQKACDEVNKVRARVGLGKIETCNPTLNLTTNKDNLISEILRERQCELGYEDTRLHDMVRRKLVSNFTKHLRGIRIYRKDGKNEPLGEGETYPDFRYETYNIQSFSRAWWTPGFWTNKWFLNAMPETEINKGYGLTQNPGW